MPVQGNGEDLDVGNMTLGDMRTEDEKLAHALELAYNVVSKEQPSQKDDEASVADTSAKEKKKKSHLGTHAMIKLPYVIGTHEYNLHPYAGVVYMGDLDDELEQYDLHL